jgi:hypothetical protein
MIRDVYTGLTSREQHAIQWSGVAVAVVLWLSVAWADPRFLLIIPLAAAGFWVYHRRHRADDPDDDLDLL